MCALAIAVAAGSSACSSGGSSGSIPAVGHSAAPALQSRVLDPVDVSSLVATATSAPTPQGAVNEVPLMADSVADSIGVNTHISTMYTNSDYATVVSLVSGLGVRHVRDAIIANEPGYNAAVSQLLGSTAKLDGLTDCAGIQYNAYSPTSAAQIQQFNSAIGGKIEALEAPNEVDIRGDSTWVSDTVACLPALRKALSVPFIAPSLADPNDNASTLGNISSLIDYGNIHRYFSGHNPGSLGWGSTFSCGAYGALSWAVCLAQTNAGTKGDIVTETGYNSQTEVDEATQAKYLSRAFMVNLKAGIPYSFAYVLRDYTGDEFGGDGLVRADNSVKPAYTALKNMIAYFNDPGSAAKVGNGLSYSLSNSNLSHVLFRRRGGQYVLALWNETSSWDVNAAKPITVPAQQQAITLPSLPSSIAAYTLTDTGTSAAVTTTVVGNTIALPVDDHVTVVQFSL